MRSYHKITSVFLATVFLLSSLGLTANKMICLKSGKEKISLVPLKDCCSEKSGKETISAHCCDIQNSSFQLHDFNPVNKDVDSQTFILPAVRPYLAKTPQIQSTQSKLFFSDLPPPLHGRSLLTFISVLII